VSASGGAVTPERGGSSLPRNTDPVSLVPKADLKIRLPWRQGETYECIQGVRGTFTHNGLNEYAYDFLMPVGTIVTAAASGRVVRIKQDSREGGTRVRDFAGGNVVILDHGRGLFTQYLHLDHGGVLVREGEIVAAGQPIARSGNTGFSTTPHLHFQVQDATGQSLPASFLCVTGDGVPVQGQAYVSQNNGRGTSAFAGDSRFPRQAFAGTGIVLTDSNMPAHLLASNRVYRMRGYVADVPTSRRLSVYLMGASGGKANLWTFADVGEDGFFEVSIDLSALPMRVRQWHTGLNQSNCFALAIAPVQPDGSFWSKVSIPVTVR
jgi:murein DD-endopeptidase MepM/ murein hydrolase activator NlpD